MGSVRNIIQWLQMMFVSAIALSGFSVAATVYMVGDSAGWAVVGNVDYNKWASSKIFRVKDTLVFKYDPEFHNVVEVSRDDFHSCNATKPMATYATGNDSITIWAPGHYYYLCGFAGHCQAGQKIDIRVPRFIGPVSGPIESPMAPPQPSPPEDSLSPGPSPDSGGSILSYNRLFYGNILLLLCFPMWILF